MECNIEFINFGKTVKTNALNPALSMNANKYPVFFALSETEGLLVKVVENVQSVMDSPASQLTADQKKICEKIVKKFTLKIQALDGRMIAEKQYTLDAKETQFVCDALYYMVDGKPIQELEKTPTQLSLKSKSIKMGFDATKSIKSV